MKEKILSIFFCVLMMAAFACSVTGNIKDNKTFKATISDCNCLTQQTICVNCADLRGLTKLIPSDGEPSDMFGWSVSIDGDYAIVGAYLDDDMAMYSGSAYIFRRNAGSWLLEKKLVAPDGTHEIHFGWSVSISGDYAIIGAPLDDDMGIGSGSAYIFSRNSGSWPLEKKLVAPDGILGDQFGHFVSIDGDYAIVGAPKDDDMGYNSGSAYIFRRNAGSWPLEKKLVAFDGDVEDWFGCSGFISGDNVIIGAPYDKDMGSDSGSAYIFNRNTGNWPLEKKLTAYDGSTGDWFGCSVSISGDYAIVGARYHDDLGSNSGSAYIFRRDMGSWPLEKKLTAYDTTTCDEFGISVSISGEYAIIGAILDDDMGSDSGSAYIFQRNSGSWPLETKLTAFDGDVDDWFGLSVSIKGNLAIIGAPLNDDMGSNSGSAYVHKCCINIKIQKGFQIGIHVDIQNICDHDINNVEWTITITGGLIFQGQVTSGSEVTIPPAGSAHVSGKICGFGLITINVDTGCTKETATGFVLGPIIYIFP